MFFPSSFPFPAKHGASSPEATQIQAPCSWNSPPPGLCTQTNKTNKIIFPNLLSLGYFVSATQHGQRLLITKQIFHYNKRKIVLRGFLAPGESHSDTYMWSCEERRGGQGRGAPGHGSGGAVGLRQAEGMQAWVRAQAALRVAAVATGWSWW